MKTLRFIVSDDGIFPAIEYFQFVFLALIPLFVFISCGPNAQEIARLQKAREDSIRLAVENATKIKLERIAALQGIISDLTSQREGLQNRLVLLKAELEVAKDKMNSIKQVQFLRTPAEREQQIRNQSTIIQNLELEIEGVPTRIGVIVHDMEVAVQELKDLSAN
jgi:hypothetical protein